MSDDNPARNRCPAVYALYLPQFHRTSYNDEWWGDGYTEWVACRGAKPLFPGHYQPRSPQHDNYYDLSRVADIRAQVALARAHLIDGFALYHYYSQGQTLLETPNELLLRNTDLDIGFFLFWANESWKKAWFGQDETVVWPQRYGSPRDWAAHFRYCLEFFRDERYLKIDGKPVFAIYKDSDLPDATTFIAVWNVLAQENGFPGIYFVKASDYRSDVTRGPYSSVVTREPVYTFTRGFPKSHRLRRKIQLVANPTINAVLSRIGTGVVAHRCSYDDCWENILGREVEQGTILGGFTDWDNSPRKGYRSEVMIGATPEKFGKYMSRLLKKSEDVGSPFIVINAWNEWAEGAYLEPDQEWGDAYLENYRQARAQFLASHHTDITA